MRYYFHIVDKYGLFTDEIGFEHADRDAAIQHAGHIAAELTRGGDFFGAGLVLVASAARPRAVSTNCNQSTAAAET
ncbi:adenylylsulfate kinase-like enzyme [Bradyrhizobium sp. GM24.11]